MLYSLQRRRGVSEVEEALDALAQDVRPENTAAGPWYLGPADIAFAQAGRPPSVVELLLLLPCRLDLRRLAAALRSTLNDDFPCAAGRRVGTSLVGSDGARLSAIRVASSLFGAHPTCLVVLRPATLGQ